jgi:hypothetical protein
VVPRAGFAERLTNGVLVNWLPHDDKRTSQDFAFLIRNAEIA